ncbi:hypothetical protein HYX58_00170 [Candidatus Dependentiae bacterium]|nr:hypothetical protein [Candidatus Dependentiae bacterium]
MKQKNIYLLILSFFISNNLTAASVAIIYDTPGHYLYSGGFSSAPTDPNDSMFIIRTNNITLDFGGNVFFQDQSTLGVPGFNFIVVNPGFRNVNIVNGFAQGFTGTGIIVQDNNRGLTIDSMVLTGMTNADIELQGTVTGLTNISISNCSMATVNTSDHLAVYGIKGTNINLLSLASNLQQVSQTSLTQTCIGILLENVTSFGINNCRCLAQTASQFAAGIVMKNCKEGLVQNNLVYSSSTVNGDGSDIANGYELDSCQRILVQNCQSSVGSASAGSCNGFFAQNGDRNNFNGVLAQSNQGFLSASGILLSNEVNSNIQGCTLRETFAITASATGILLMGCSNCNIQSNNILDSVGTFSFAIIDDAGASTSAITSNRAFNCGTGYAVTYPNGIQLPVIVGSLSLNPPGLPSSAGGLIDNILINP